MKIPTPTLTLILAKIIQIIFENRKISILLLKIKGFYFSKVKENLKIGQEFFQNLIKIIYSLFLKIENQSILLLKINFFFYKKSKKIWKLRTNFSKITTPTQTRHPKISPVSSRTTTDLKTPVKSNLKCQIYLYIC